MAPACGRQARMLRRLFLFSLIAFGVEVGVFLVALPWSSLWELNYFLFRFPQLQPWLHNFYLRGAISGLGLVDLGLAFSYAARFGELLERWAQTPAPAPAATVISAGSDAESHPRGQTA